MIRVLIGDMFQSDAKTLVNTVNCVGVMGKGVALEFKKRWPKLMEDYADRCRKKQVKPGTPYIYTDIFGASIVNFPTKDHWRSASRYSDIEKGLEIFVEKYKTWNVTSVAFPPLGCGNGGLEWEIVGPLMYKMLSKVDIPVEIFAPFGTPATQLTAEFLSPSQHRLFNEVGHKGTRDKKFNPNWLVMLEVMDQLERQPYAPKVGRTIFQKICHAVTALGVETELDFKKANYGPFSEAVKKVLGNLANANLVQEVQLGRMNHLKTGPEYEHLRDKHKDVLIANRLRIEKTVDLFSRIKNTEQAEEVATVFFAVSKLKEEQQVPIVPEREVYDFVLSWKKAWNTEEKKEAIASAIRNLAMLGWIRVSLSDCLPLSEFA
ncbi:MAG: macro domain-containing protein [Gammaproteobacteria bacterium]|nr:macro domain-containing protein [Gammaproteobacteria bacterium]MBU1490676.1 macro domain-containing protein [Gammaproteobacteria bacterium]MBU2067284.1 macro domain-containing protein [Gammaproteobacteria bacterium]MBU2140095.1 macro domain-containing protein [Gammaproteobacteria bacterium]MBU2217728.1 macro domain-containing protein [Gammaproteobacteria bacterium]